MCTAPMCDREGVAGSRAARGAAGPGGTEPSLQYIPVAAFKALEEAHAEAERERASTRASMVGLRMRHASSRLAFVGRWEALRSAALLFAAMAAWRGAVQAGRAAAAQAASSEAQASLGQLRDVCAQRRQSVVPAAVERLLGQEEEQRARAAVRGWRMQAVRQVGPPISFIDGAPQSNQRVQCINA